MLTAEQLSEFLEKLKNLLARNNGDDPYQTLVDAPFHDKLYSVQLDLGIIALAVVNSQRKFINRVALSDTQLAKDGDEASSKPFHEITIPYGHKTNIVAKAIRTDSTLETLDWKDLFVPALSESDSRFNQAASGIGGSIVAPFKTKHTTGALIFDFFQPLENLNEQHHAFVEEYTNIAKSVMAKQALLS